MYFQILLLPSCVNIYIILYQLQWVIIALSYRVMVVLEPLKITIENFPSDKPIQVSVPDFPNEPEKGSHTVVFNKILYIEASDFKETPEKGYRRLTPKQIVGLRHAGYVIQVGTIIN